MPVIRFEVYGSREDKDLIRFINFVENKYNDLTGEIVEIELNHFIALAVLNTKRKLLPEQIEKCRFLLENEFAKHFQKVRVVVRQSLPPKN